MDRFEYKNGRLFCEQVDVADIAADVGTPVYIYSAATLLHHYKAFEDAFADLEATICFSIKSLSNVHILRLLAEAGSGFDIVSGGELARARGAGADCSRIVYAGPGKTDAEITEAIDAEIGLFNIESEQEFENLSRLAAEAGKRPSAALRINPDVDPKTHRFITTGKKETKFGVDLERGRNFFETYGRDANVNLTGVHLHLGSSIYSAGPYVEAITKSLKLIGDLREMGFEIDTLDIGGGFGADYEEGRSPLATDYAKDIVPLLKGTGLKIVLEPGRQIAGNAGILLAKVLYVKKGGERNFVIVDATMADLIRPGVYGAEHFVYPARLAEGAPAPQRRMDYVPSESITVDVVGGVCEPGDFLAKDRMLPLVGRGDLIAVFTAGAYGFVMSSQYNARPRCAEVLVEDAAFRVIRRRETYDDLLDAEMNL